MIKNSQIRLLTNLPVYRNLRTTITATDNGAYAITAIGGSAFKEKSTIVSVSLPDTVTTIGGDAFRSMGGLTSVRLSANLQSIGNCAFFGDSRLTSVTPLLRTRSHPSSATPSMGVRSRGTSSSPTPLSPRWRAATHTARSWDRGSPA